jgi:hypothetical protein
MKFKILMTFLTACISMSGFAQLSAVDYNSEEYAQFKGSKTYIVKTGDARFDEELAGAMKDLWKVTPYETINNADLETKLIDKSASFIIPVVISTGTPNQNYHYLALLNGGKKKIGKYGYDDMLAYCPINHWSNEFENTQCAYRVRNMVESMVQSMEIVQKKNIHGSSKAIVDGLRKVYNEKSPRIKDRTLLFCDETLVPNMGKGIAPADIEKATNVYKTMLSGNYPYKFEICNKEKLEKVIKEKSTEYYYYQPAVTLNKCMFVFDPATGEVLYFDYKIQGLKINDDNIKELANAIKTGNK